jgi:hypothetical protein
VPDRTGGAGGDYTAVIPAASLNGAIIDGNWSLRVFDDTGGTTGTLGNWSLSIIKLVGSGFFTTFNGPADISSVSYSGSLNSVATVTVTPTIAGTHTYTATTADANGCSTTSNTVTITVQETPDVYIAADYCSINGRIKLTALGGMAGATYAWSSGESTQAIVVDLVNIYSVTITNPNGCSATAFLDVSNELVTDGSFTNFNAASPSFVTEYTQNQAYWDDPAPYDWHASGLHPEGRYAVNISAWYNYPGNQNGYHPNFHGRDHTNNDPDERNFLMVNGHTALISPPEGGPQRQRIIWQQTVTVQPNTNYYFSAWAMNLNPVSPAILQFEVNGVLVGTIANLNLAEKPAAESAVRLSNWVRFYSNPLWNSGTATTAIIRIRNLNTIAGGNDFALDDISFGTLDPLPLVINAVSADVCKGDNIKLYSNAEHGLDPIIYNWTGPNGWTSTEQNPVIPNATEANEGSYIINATDGYGCNVVPDTVFVVVNEAPTADAGDDQTVCTANPVVYLNGMIGGSATSAIWSGGTGIFANSGALDSTYTLSAAETTEGFVTLFLTTNDPVGACGSVQDTIVITVHNSLEIASSFKKPFCFGGEDGTATATVTRPSAPPYTYLWSDGQTTATATDLTAGTYWVMVTDYNGCVATDTFDLTEPEPFIIVGEPIVIAPSCYGAKDGMAIVVATGGTEPHNYNWDSAAGSQNNDTAFYLAAGNYNVFVSDSAGCAATIFTVTIPQPEAPWLTCPPDAADTIIDDGCAMLVHRIANPTAVGFCLSDTTYVLTGATTGSGTGLVNYLLFKVGITEVEYTVYDTVGNSHNCSFEVLVRRLQIPPTSYTCPADTVEADVNPASCVATVTLLPIDTIDVCHEIDSIWNNSPYRTSYANASGDYPAGTTTFHWYIQDVSGNMDSCKVIVIVNDTIPPMLSCPVSVADNAGLGNCSKVPATLNDPSFIDACSTANLTWIMTGATTGFGNGTVTDSTFNVGVTNVTYTATDAAGNSSSCSFTVTIIDITPPNLNLDSCINVSDTASFNNCTKISGKINNPDYSDACWPVSTLILTWTMTGATSGSGFGTVTDSVFNVGVTTVTYKVTDPNGNFITCSFTVTIVDITPPNITIVQCIDVQEVAAADSCSKTTVTIVDPTYSDACWPVGSMILSWTMSGATIGSGFGSAAHETYNIGVTTVTFIVTDPDGNSATCDFNVTIIHLEIPVTSFTCPADTVTISATPGRCDAYVQLDPLTYVDPCNEIDSVWNESPFRTNYADASGTYPLGITRFKWYITDISGNIASCTVVVIVNDLLPTLVCPDDTTFFADFGELFASGKFLLPPVFSDNCPDSTLTWSMTLPDATVLNSASTGINIISGPGTYNIGVTTIQYTFTDANGHVVSCPFTVTVTGAPVIDCPNDTTVYVGATAPCTNSFDPDLPVLMEGIQPITWRWTITDPDGTHENTGTFVGSTGNPGPPSIGIYPFELGTSTITWTATNISGADSCEHLVIVIDTVPPTFNSTPITNCVDLIQSATYTTGTPEPFNRDNLIIYSNPDVYTFISGNKTLDLTELKDNCCALDDMTIKWKIDFAQTPDPDGPEGTMMSNGSSTGTGQPSEYIDPVTGLQSDMLFPGDGVTFTTVTHTITYEVWDCNGNGPVTKQEDIIVTPRPQIIKMN